VSLPAAASGFPQLDRFELLEEIGHGGMATVYRARDPRLGREVAVKIIHKHLRENKEVATRFVAEARAAAKLRHPGIVEVFDVSNEDDPERYLVVELLRGTTLRKVLQQHRDMPAEIGAAIVLELCAALEHAHASAVVHRDVKPENVLVELPSDRAQACADGAPCDGPASNDTAAPGPRSDSKRGAKPADRANCVVIKLTDFGIAKILDAQGVTSTGQVLGSPAHMAPEQIEGGEVDARTDVFALGVLMYECLVGHLPFEGKNPAQVLRRVLDGLFAPADRERATVGGRWSKILARALAREADARTRSPGALGKEIEAELEAVGILDPPSEIAAYFTDPEGYAAALTARLVPRLIARGEKARKSGDVQGAADDFNRALALAPSDMTIMKRVTSLTSSASRRILIRRVSTIVVGSAAIGLATFGVVRVVRSRPPPVTPPEVAIVPSKDPTQAEVPGEGETDPGEDDPDSVPGPTAAVSGRRPRFKIRGLASAAASAQPAATSSGTRNVAFSIIPKNAQLTLNGQVVESFNRSFQLAPGPHSVQVTYAQSKCCKPLARMVNVEPPPAGAPDAIQTFVLRLEPLPGTVTLRGPSSASLSCPAINLSVFGGATAAVTLPEAVWMGRCSFSDGGEPKSRSVTLNAGEVNAVAWPVD
jgi:serine/threonine-protein kinase